MTFQSPFSCSLFASVILLSQTLRRSPDCRACSKTSVDAPTSESTSNFRISIFEARDIPGCDGRADTILPPNPKEALIGLSIHFGAFANENDAVCGCVCAFEKKSSPSSV